MALIRLEAGDFSASVSSRGGALWSFSLRHGGDNMPLLQTRGEVGRAEAGLSGCFPLVPFGNRVRGNRFTYDGREYSFLPNTEADPFYLHGDGWLADWLPEEVSDDHVSLVLTREQDHRSPYTYEARQEIALDENGLRLCLVVTNYGTHAMPFGLGWHPFFPMTKETQLRAPASDYWTEGDAHLSGHREALPPDLDFNAPRSLPDRWVNNGFEGWDGRADIYWPDRGLTLAIHASEAFERYQIFVSDTAFDPEWTRDFFCFEPMSHAVDAHNAAGGGGLVRLEPGQSLGGAMTLTPRLMPKR